MSKKTLWATTLPGCLALAIVWSIAALSGSSLANPPDGDGNHTHGGGGGGGGGGNTIPVTVTFQDLIGDGLMSDCFDCPATCVCLSPYIHKVDDVVARIGSSGNLFVKLTKGNQPATRTLFFDFSDCASPGECYPPLIEGSSEGPMNFGTSGVELAAMSVGDVREDLSLTLWLDLTIVGGALWPLTFDPLNENCPGSSFVTVTRIDLETWEIEATIDDVACLARQAGGNNQIFSGLYRMPFKFTVQKN